jgi:hypothetical protein
VILDCLALPFKPSTAKNLSNAIRRMLEFFGDRGFQQPYGLVAFFHWLAAIAMDGRSRPESALLQAHSAAKIFFDLVRMRVNPALDPSISVVITGLTRKFTKTAQQHTGIFLRELPRIYAFLRSLPPIEDHAPSWDPKILRAATILVLGLHIAARPSDLVCIDRSTMAFAESPISSEGYTSSFASRFAKRAHSGWGPFRQVRSLSFSILDSKTDKFSRGYDASVFALPPGDENLCPVALCAAYLACFPSPPGAGDTPRDRSDPLFVSLAQPAHGIAAGTVSNAVALLFEQAGAPHFTGDSIRPTSATLMFIHGVANEIIMKVGRWSEDSLALVLRHYVRFTSDFVEVSRAMQGTSGPQPTATADLEASPLFATLAGKSVHARESDSESSEPLSTFTQDEDSESSMIDRREPPPPRSLEELFEVSASRLNMGPQSRDAADSMVSDAALNDLSEELMDPVLLEETVLPYKHLFE